MDKLDSDERQKIASLQREKKESSSGVSWMYKGEKPESEDYLLGRRIDKHVDGEEEKKEDEASVIFGERIKANIALDVAAKMREDPLFAIRRKEEESRKKLLENPIRMKELQKLISQQEKQKDKKAKKEKKEKKEKRKKKKKKKGSDSDSESEEDGGEDDVMKKYLSILTSKHGGVEEQSEVKERKGDKRSGNREDPKYGRYKSDRQQQIGRERDGDAYNKRETRGGHRNDRDFRQNFRGSSYEQDHRSRPGRDEKRDRSRSRDREMESHKMEKGKYRNEGRYERFDGRAQERDKRGRQSEDRQKRRSQDRDLESSAERRRADVDRRKDRNHGSPDRDKRGDRGKKVTQARKGREVEKEERKRKTRSSSSSPSASSSSSADKRSSLQESHQYGLIMSKSAEEASKSRRKRSHSSSPPYVPSYKKKQVKREATPPKRALTAEEKKRRLEEMMKDAEWRDEQRYSNVKKYEREEKDREDKERDKQSSGFISSLMVEHAESSSVEDRIRRNKYNIQRTRRDLDKNFTQK